MNPILVNTAEMERQGTQLQSIATTLGSVSEASSLASTSLSGRISGSARISSSISNSTNELLRLVRSANDMGNALLALSQLYSQTEEKNSEITRSTTGSSVGGDLLGLVKLIGKEFFESSASKGSFQFFPAFLAFLSGDLEAKTGASVFSHIKYGDSIKSSFEIGDAEVDASLKPGYVTYKDPKHSRPVKQTKIKDEKKQKSPEKEWYDKKGTILDTKAEAKGEASLLHRSYEKTGKVGEGSVDAKVATAESHGELSAGLYVYDKDESGKIIKAFSPGVDAEVGASVGLVKLSGDGRLGFGKDHDMLSAYGRASADLAEAEAKAGLHVNSKQIYAGASAEANLAEVKGAAGVSVLGTDLGVTGGLKVGVGAHAEAGFTDGKLKVDIGAAFGVGVSVGFEIDVSGTIDAVVGAGKSFLSNLWK